MKTYEVKQAYGSKIPDPQCEHSFTEYPELVPSNSENVLRMDEQY